MASPDHIACLSQARVAGRTGEKHNDGQIQKNSFPLIFSITTGALARRRVVTLIKFSRGCCSAPLLPALTSLELDAGATETGPATGSSSSGFTGSSPASTRLGRQSSSEHGRQTHERNAHHHLVQESCMVT